MKKSPIKIGHVMVSMNKSRIPKAVSATIIAPRWPSIVGPAVARHTEPYGLLKGSLLVRCDSSTWSAELANHKSLIVENITKMLGKDFVSEIKITIARPQPNKKTAPKEPEYLKVPLSDQEVAMVEDVSGMVPKDLKKDFGEAMASYIIRRKSFLKKDFFNN
ncbi:MAG: DUF721 domain-containing protein [Caldisericia bacterium]|nr:DUF721 domain-containing protein [Caldisericia bacterium]NMD13941.1 DUF721 domain-containing protein [Caldisericales bacterium]